MLNFDPSKGCRFPKILFDHYDVINKIDGDSNIFNNKLNLTVNKENKIVSNVLNNCDDYRQKTYHWTCNSLTTRLIADDTLEITETTPYTFNDFFPVTKNVAKSSLVVPSHTFMYTNPLTKKLTTLFYEICLTAGYKLEPGVDREKKLIYNQIISKTCFHAKVLKQPLRCRFLLPNFDESYKFLNIYFESSFLQLSLLSYSLIY